MPSIDFNPLRERFGRVVLRQRGDRVFFARAPRRDLTPSVAALRGRLRFLEGAAYSKLVSDHPARRAPYEAIATATGKPLFSTIMADFLKKPVIRNVDTDGYHGAIGDPILVFTRADLDIAQVRVALRRADDDTPIEAGAAVPELQGFRYLATKVVPVGTELFVDVYVADADGLEISRTTRITVA